MRLTSFFFNYIVQWKHSQRTHIHPYEHRHAHMSFKIWHFICKFFRFRCFSLCFSQFLYPLFIFRPPEWRDKFFPDLMFRHVGAHAPPRHGVLCSVVGPQPSPDAIVHRTALWLPTRHVAVSHTSLLMSPPPLPHRATTIAWTYITYPPPLAMRKGVAMTGRITLPCRCGLMWAASLKKTSCSLASLVDRWQMPKMLLPWQCSYDGLKRPHSRPCIALFSI